MYECMYGERAVLAVGWRAEGLGLYGDWATTITTITITIIITALVLVIVLL
jgi:hypothetical protein